MTPSELSVFRQVVDTAKVDSQIRMQKILVEEHRLRNLLSDLERQERAARDCLEQDGTLRRIGGDVAWHSWIGQSRQKLNTSLAQVLAQKESVIATYQEAGGRSLALEALNDQEATRHQNKQQKSLASDLDQLGLLAGRFR